MPKPTIFGVTAASATSRFEASGESLGKDGFSVCTGLLALDLVVRLVAEQ